MQTTGSCFCGAVEYAAEIDERRVAICHCTDCQIMGGSAFRVLAPLDPARIEWTRGQPRCFEKTAESGNVRGLWFCADCGTHLVALPPASSPSQATAEGAGAFGALRVATSRDAAALVPKFELWCKSRQPWLPPFDSRVCFDGQP